MQVSEQVKYENYSKRKRGFTLAEVLLVITVIGIIASYVIPDLVISTQNQQLKTAWRKKYSEVSQATNMIIMDLGSLIGITGGADDNYSLQLAYQKYMNTVKSCNYANQKGSCWHLNDQWYDYDGITSLTTSAVNIGVASILTDGSFITFNYSHNDCSYSAGDPAWSWTGVYTICGEVWVDTNGFKGPNTKGKDIMRIIISGDGIHPYGAYGNNRALQYEALYLMQ